MKTNSFYETIFDCVNTMQTKINFRSLTKSRSNLRELSKNPSLINKFSAFDQVLQVIEGRISVCINQHKTKYTMSGSDFGHTTITITTTTATTSFPYQTNKQVSFYTELMENREFRSEFVDVLQREYPDCTIEYTEPRIEDGKIVFPSLSIDWT